MDVRRGSMIGALALMLGGGSVAFAMFTQQDKPKPAAPPAGAQAMPPAPKPGPEHKLLEKWAGTWDCDVEESFMGGAPNKSKSKYVARVALGGFWVLSDFEGTMMGGPFTGHSVTGYDPAVKKFVDNWFDSTGPGGATAEGTFDEKTNTMTWAMQMRDPSGAMMKGRETDVWKDADTHEWTMFMPGAGGKEMQALKIVYHRKK